MPILFSFIEDCPPKDLLQQELVFIAKMLDELHFPIGLGHNDMHQRTIMYNDETGIIVYD